MRRLQDILGAERNIRILKKQPDGVFLEQMAKKIPANLLRDHAEKSVKEVAESGVDYETINPKTLSTYWGYFQEFFNWAVDRRYLTSNPIDRIKPAKVKSNQKSRSVSMGQMYLVWSLISPSSAADTAASVSLLSHGWAAIAMSRAQA